MTLGELQDQIAFEGGVTNIDTLGGAIISIVKDIADSYSAQTKYADLYVPDYLVTITSTNQSVIVLPADVQHIDFDSIRYWIANDSTRQVQLFKGRNYRRNTGQAISIYRISPSPTPRLELYPTDQVAIGDTIYINYWKRPSSLLTDEAQTVIPDALIPSIKLKAIARIGMITGNKAALAANGLAAEAHSRHFGEVDLSDANGQ